MLSRWTQNLGDEKEKQDFESEIKGSRRVLERLRDIALEDEAELDRAERNKSIYDTPSWAYLQAHNNGDRERLNKFKRLLEI